MANPSAQETIIPFWSRKTCSRCKIEKPIEEFNNSKSGKYGRHHHCRTCAHEVKIKTYSRDQTEPHLNTLRNGKSCKQCGQHKTASEFNIRRKSIDWFTTYCKECTRKRYLGSRETQLLGASKNHLKYKFNLTIEEFNRMSEIQGDVCKICKKPNKNGNRLCVDHNHRTGKVRALLCRSCNSGIGGLGDNPTLCRIAASYLEEMDG